MSKYLKEAIMWAFMILPFIYLAFLWSSLPDRVPTHFNLEGNADNWSGKGMLFLIPCALPLFIYLLMLIIPFLDPKNKLEQMGDKLFTFRMILVIFLSLLSVFLLNVTKAGNIENPNFLIALLGGLFAAMGNYFQTLRPNYFIGIRTPWTLESENVWKKTHHLGGRIWLVGGILIAVMALIVGNNLAVAIIFGIIMTVMVILPMAYSYNEFKKEKKMSK